MKSKSGIVLLISSAVIISIAVWVIFIPQNRYYSVQENQMTVADSTKNNTRIMDSIDTADEDARDRARMVTTEELIVEDFSEYYYCIITVFKKEEFSNTGKSEIYSKKNNRKLLSVKSSTINWGLYSSKPDSNNKIKYDEQDVIVYEDFNFDGIKDFAFLDGFNNKYGEPSYIVYLVSDRKIVYSREFTHLARYYLGMFDVDRKRKIISVHYKGGCCYTAYKEYKVVNNSPAAVLIEEQEIKDNYLFETTRKLLKNGKWSKKTTKEKAHRDY